MILLNLEIITKNINKLYFKFTISIKKNFTYKKKKNIFCINLVNYLKTLKYVNDKNYYYIILEVEN